MALAIPGLGSVSAHPDPPTAPGIKVSVRVNEVKFLAKRHWLGGFAPSANEMADGLDGNAEVFMAILVNRATHGSFSDTKENDSLTGLYWYPYGANSDNVPAYTHLECSPVETPIVVSGHFLEIDNSLDAGATYGILSTVASVGAATLAGAIKGGASGSAVGPVGTVIAGAAGTVVGFGVGLAGAFDDNDDWGLFSQIYSGPGSQKFKTAGKTGSTEVTTEVTVVEKESPPCLGPITATFSGTTTTYSVPFTTHPTPSLTWSKVGDNCGTFTPNSPDRNMATWNHPHPPCGEGTHVATITATARDSDWECKAEYTAGSSAGTGPNPGPCTDLHAPPAFQQAGGLQGAGTETIFDPLRGALAMVPSLGPAKGEPPGPDAIEAVRDSYRSLLVGLARVAAAQAVEASEGVTGSEEAADAYLSADALWMQGDAEGAVDGFEHAYDMAVVAVETGSPAATTLPSTLVPLTDHVTTRTGRGVAIPVALLGGTEGVELSVDAPETFDVTISPLAPGPAAFEVGLGLEGTTPGSYELPITATDGAESVMRVLTILVTPEPASCLGELASIVGTEGADRLKASPKVDVIAALGGNDRVQGAGRSDLVCGGPGSDLLEGGPGDDKLVGGSGTDTCVGDAGRDKLLCEE
jgi:hypothetical protein